MTKLQHKAQALEIKADTLVDTPEYCTFTGYAATFGNEDLVGDIIEKGAFAECLRTKNKYPLYWDHSSKEMIGSVTVVEDANGLWVSEGKINKGTSRGKDVAALLKGGDLGTMSIGFFVKDYTYDTNDKQREWPIRVLKSIELREVSLVSDPANPQAKVASVKSLEEIREAKSLAEIEDVLRDHGVSREGAKALISKVKEFSKPREVVDESKSASVRDESEALASFIYQTVIGIQQSR